MLFSHIKCPSDLICINKDFRLDDTPDTIHRLRVSLAQGLIPLWAESSRMIWWWSSKVSSTKRRAILILAGTALCLFAIHVCAVRSQLLWTQFNLNDLLRLRHVFRTLFNLCSQHTSWSLMTNCMLQMHINSHIHLLHNYFSLYHLNITWILYCVQYRCPIR